jgi:hypothetical protein
MTPLPITFKGLTGFGYAPETGQPIYSIICRLYNPGIAFTNLVSGVPVTWSIRILIIIIGLEQSGINTGVNKVPACAVISLSNYRCA